MTSQLNYHKTTIRDVGLGKWAITFLGLNLQQDFAQGSKELVSCLMVNQQQLHAF